MTLYWLDGELISTRVRHSWRCEPQPYGELWVYWLAAGRWVLEIVESEEKAVPPDGQMASFALHRAHQEEATGAWRMPEPYVTWLPTEEAWAMLHRHGHGPDLWTCACEHFLCRFPCF